MCTEVAVTPHYTSTPSSILTETIVQEPVRDWKAFFNFYIEIMPGNCHLLPFHCHVLLILHEHLHFFTRQRLANQE
jgi:hypothetical protein